MQVIKFREQEFMASKEQLDAIKFVIDAITEVAKAGFEISKEDTRDPAMSWREVARALGYTDGIEEWKDYMELWSLRVAEWTDAERSEG